MSEIHSTAILDVGRALPIGLDMNLEASRRTLRFPPHPLMVWLFCSQNTPAAPKRIVMKKRWTAALLLGVQLCAQPAYAWDAVGHQVIARIAWDNMTPRARSAAVALLSNAPADSDLRTLWPAVGTSEV